MMLLGMSSKRQRRPNVRLGEIGDVSAALCAVNSIRPRQNLEEKRCNSYELENPVCRESSSVGIQEFTINGLVDDLQNLENWNPNSSNKSVFEFTDLDETDTSIPPKLDFGNVGPRGRVMKRRGRSTRGKKRVTGKAWSSWVNSEIGDKTENGYVGNEFIRPGMDEFHGENETHDDEFCEDQLVDELEGSSDRDTLNRCKDVYEGEWVKSVSDWQMVGESDYDELSMRDDDSKEHGVSNSGDDPCTGPGSSGEADDMGFSGNAVNSVGDWLEEMGFRKYVGLFEMHEVDSDVLPQLTVEDLKDMGINAVGTRRKLYTAIQLLKEVWFHVNLDTSRTTELDTLTPANLEPSEHDCVYMMPIRYPDLPIRKVGMTHDSCHFLLIEP